MIPADDKQTLTKYRARKHDIYIGSWGPDYQDPHTNAETFAMNVDNTDAAKSKTLAWRNAWDIPDMTKQTQAAVKERDAKKRAEMYQAIQREHQRSLAVHDHVPADGSGCPFEGRGRLRDGTELREQPLRGDQEVVDDSMIADR